MTKTELKKRAREFIANQNTNKDDWYCSDKTAAAYVLGEFLKDEFNIDLETEDV